MAIFKTPAQRLLSAAKKGEWAKVDELLRQGVAPTDCDQNHWTPLHWAAWEGHLDVVTRLLQAPAINLEAHSLDKHRTPIYLAACQGHESVFAALLAAGARVNVYDQGGYSILHAAAEAGHRTIVRLLLDHLAQGTPQDLVLLLEAVDNESRWTALHWAAYQGHSAVVRRLVDAGADTSARDPQGRTPADIACSSGAPRVRQYKDYVLHELRSAHHQANQDGQPSSNPLSAMPSTGGSATGSLSLGMHVGNLHHPRQSPPASVADGSDLHSGSLNLGPAPPNGSATGTSLSGSLRPGAHLPSTPTMTTYTDPATGMRISQQFTTSTPPPSPHHDQLGSATAPNMRHNGSFLTAPNYPNVQYSSAGSSSINSTSHAKREFPLQVPRAFDNRQPRDQATGVLSQSPESSSWDGTRAPPADHQRLPHLRTDDNIHAVGGAAGAAIGAAGPVMMLLGTAMAVGGAIASGNPGQLLRGLFDIATHLVELCEDAVYCRYKSTRLKERGHALILCLQALPERLPQHAAHVQKALEHTLLNLRKVLQNVCDLIGRFSSRSDNLFGRTMEFLRSMGFRDEFEILDTELHSCTSQLMLVLQIAHIIPADLPNPLRQLHEWQQQNQMARQEDLKELEQRILLVVCGLGQQGVAVAEAVQNLETLLQAHNQDLRQMVGWLERMDARHVSLSDHLQRVADRVDEVAVMAERILAYLQPSESSQGTRDSQPPPFLIPSSTILLDERPQLAPWGAFGVVVKAFRDRFGLVAIKMYNINQVGELDMEAAVREAVKLCRVNHHNVVRCFGILTDETNHSGKDSKSGSLVMEWVDGGDLYKWLQKRDSLRRVNVGWRVQLMLQVAAGMKHLHQQKLVHGDIKPQNMLLQITDRTLQAEDGTPLEIVPIVVKICDFGLAKYNATAQSTASTLSTAKCSPRYASPERLLKMRRSYEDDIYAFGMLMYFAVTSQEPFDNCPDHDLMSAVTRGIRPDIDAWATQQKGGDWASLALMYAALAKRCWQHRPEDRPLNGFQEIYQALEEMLWPSSGPRVP